MITFPISGSVDVCSPKGYMEENVTEHLLTLNLLLLCIWHFDLENVTKDETFQLNECLLLLGHLHVQSDLMLLRSGLSGCQALAVSHNLFPLLSIVCGICGVFEIFVLPKDEHLVELNLPRCCCIVCLYLTIQSKIQFKIQPLHFRF